MEKVIISTGNGLAKLGGLGATALGVGLGVAANLAGAGTGLATPLVGAMLFGPNGANAREGVKALEEGPGGPTWEAHLKRHGTIRTQADAGAHILTAGLCVAELAAAFAVTGGSPILGLLVGAPLMMGTAVLMGRASGRANLHLIEQRLTG